MKTIPFLVVTAFMLGGCNSVAAGTPDTITVYDIYDIYMKDDYVIEGTVEALEKVQVEPDDFFPGLGGRKKLPVVKATFRVSRVLIGELDREQITVVGFDWYRSGRSAYVFDLEVGKRYILGLLYTDKGSFNAGGNFTMGNNDSRFLIEGDSWRRKVWAGNPRAGRLADLYRAIDGVKKLRSIEHLAGEADVIVRGAAEEITDTDEESRTGEKMRVRTITVDVRRIYKGNIEKEGFEFSFLRSVSYYPSWWKAIPKINEGEEWIVLLKWIPEIGYYPFAGRNGMFKIEGDRLIRNNSVVLPMKSDEMERTIERAVAEGRDGDE